MEASVGKKDFAVNCLGKLALRWYMRMLKEGKEPLHWEEFSDMLVERFGQDLVTAKHTAQQARMKNKETPREWADRLKLLYSKAGMEIDAWTARHFITNARTELVNALRYQRFTTLEEAVVAAEYVAAEHDVAKANSSRNHTNNDSSFRSGSTRVRWVDESDSAYTRGDGYLRQRPATSNASLTNSWSERRRAADFGFRPSSAPAPMEIGVRSAEPHQPYRNDYHFNDRNQRASATRVQNGRTVRPPITCYRCGEPGHYSRDCPTNRPSRGGNRETPPQGVQDDTSRVMVLTDADLNHVSAVRPRRRVSFEHHTVRGERPNERLIRERRFNRAASPHDRATIEDRPDLPTPQALTPRVRAREGVVEERPIERAEPLRR